jgi:hypothetical protein
VGLCDDFCTLGRSPSEAASGASGPYNVWHRVFLARLPQDNYLVSVEATSAREYGPLAAWVRTHTDMPSTGTGTTGIC